MHKKLSHRIYSLEADKNAQSTRHPTSHNPPRRHQPLHRHREYQRQHNSGSCPPLPSRYKPHGLCFFHMAFGTGSYNCEGGNCSWPNFRIPPHMCSSNACPWEKIVEKKKLKPCDINRSDVTAGNNTKTSVHNRSSVLYINDTNSDLKFLFDSGASLSLLPCRDMTKKHCDSNFDLQAANGTKIKTYGKMLLWADFGFDNHLPWVFTIAEVTRPIIGRFGRTLSSSLSSRLKRQRPLGCLTAEMPFMLSGEGVRTVASPYHRKILDIPLCTSISDGFNFRNPRKGTVSVAVDSYKAFDTVNYLR